MNRNSPNSLSRRSLSRRAFLRHIGWVVALPGALAACGGTGTTTDELGGGGPDELFGELASFEVISGRPQRVMVGLSTVDQRVLHGGSVDLRFTPPEGTTANAFTAPAPFLQVGGQVPSATKATLGPPSEGLGVYGAQVTFSVEGMWMASVLRSGTEERLTEVPVMVKATSDLPDLGAMAPRTQNPVIGSPIPPVQIDSRSGPDGLGAEFADEPLHRHVIADLVDAGRPFLVVVSTPAYCQSKFCGPITDLVNAEAQRRDSTTGMAFVHLEVWQDVQTNRVNPWAAEWILGDGEGREPWVFAVNAAGQVVARYDNVLTPENLAEAIALAEGRA